MQILPKPLKNRTHDRSQQKTMLLQLPPSISKDKLNFVELNHFSNNHLTIMSSFHQFLFSIHDIFVVFIGLIEFKEVMIVLYHICHHYARFRVF